MTFRIPPTRLIHVDLDPHEPGRNYPTAIAATADAALALEAIADAYGDPTPDRGYDWDGLRQEREAFLAQSPCNAASDEFPLLPERILADVRAAVPDAILVTDVGWNKNGVAQQYPVDSPDSFHTPGGFSTMGFGPAAVLGVASAGTGRPAIALVGDGAFGSNPSVIATAVEMGIAPVWVVMNNAAFGTIAGLQRKHYGSGYGCEFEAGGASYTPDFAAMAVAFGAEGIRIGGADELQAALRARMRLGPSHRHRRADAEHAGDDARGVGHRAHLPGRPMTGEARTAVTRAHEGEGAGQASRPGEWATAITATTDTQVFVRGVALDEAIGRESFPAMLLRLWRGDAATDAEAALMGACMVAAIDHGPLAPSALVARTVASTRAGRMSALAGGILSFGDLHGAVVTRAMQIVATVPAEGDLEAWADARVRDRASGRPPAARDRPSLARPRPPRGAAARRRDRARRRPSCRRGPRARRPGRRARRPSRGGQHRRRPGGRPDRPAARPRVRRLPVRHRQELRARGAHRRGTRTRAADAHDRSHCRAV